MFALGRVLEPEEGSQVASLLTMICLIVLFCCTIRAVSIKGYVHTITYYIILHICHRDLELIVIVASNAIFMNHSLPHDETFVGSELGLEIIRRVRMQWRRAKFTV